MHYTSYQGGHNEYFKYSRFIARKGAGHIKIFGGGGVPFPGGNQRIDGLRNYSYLLS